MVNALLIVKHKEMKLLRRLHTLKIDVLSEVGGVR